jgi:putative membrane protein
MKFYIILALKGVAMGAANVIPGVSGGTIALITGIFERLINSIKSFNLRAIKLLLSFKISEFLAHTDIKFLTTLLFGVVVALFSLAKLLEFLFANYSVYVWAYFFGLILASIFYVGATISKINFGVVISFIAGTAVALTITFLNPAVENDNAFYVFLCGALAISSMVLPGVSGSFVLILLGNYELIVIEAVTQFKLDILIPFFFGCAAGLLGFSYFLSWVFRKYKDATIALLTGFILGSLLIIWPWKNTVYRTNALGELILKNGEPIVFNYERILPESFNTETIAAIAIMIIGVVTIFAIEKTAAIFKSSKQTAG